MCEENRVKNKLKYFASTLMDWSNCMRRRNIRPTDYDMSYDIDGLFFCTGDGKEIGKPLLDYDGQRKHFINLVKRTYDAQQINPKYYEVIFYYEHEKILIEDYKNNIEDLPFIDPEKCLVIEYIDSDNCKWTKLPIKMNIKQAMDYFETYWETSRKIHQTSTPRAIEIYKQLKNK